jgi:hypothetical protein
MTVLGSGFSTPSMCYVMNVQSQMQPRLSFERIDFEGQRRLMLSRQSQAQGLWDTGKRQASLKDFS